MFKTIFEMYFTLDTLGYSDKCWHGECLPANTPAHRRLGLEVKPNEQHSSSSEAHVPG